MNGWSYLHKLLGKTHHTISILQSNQEILEGGVKVRQVAEENCDTWPIDLSISLFC